MLDFEIFASNVILEWKIKLNNKPKKKPIETAAMYQISSSSNNHVTNKSMNADTPPPKIYKKNCLKENPGINFPTISFKINYL